MVDVVDRAPDAEVHVCGERVAPLGPLDEHPRDRAAALPAQVTRAEIRVGHRRKLPATPHPARLPRTTPVVAIAAIAIFEIERPDCGRAAPTDASAGAPHGPHRQGVGVYSAQSLDQSMTP